MNRYKVCEMILIWALIPSGCAGMPVGANEILPMTQQQIATGVYNIANGGQPIYFVLRHTSGLRVLLWPGAQSNGQTLWNAVCVQVCQAGWQNQVIAVSKGFSMTGKRASEFAAYLRAGGWHQVPIAAASAGYSSVKSWLDLMASSLTGFFLVIPAGVVPPQATEAKS
jgi:hypothetical protein